MKQSLGSTHHPDPYDDDIFTSKDYNLFDINFNGESINDIKVEIDSILAQLPDKIDAKHLAKVWRIKNEVDTKVLEQATNLPYSSGSNTLFQYLPTNNRMS